MGNWNEKIQVKKGTIGETLVKNYLESKGWIVYSPVTEKAHAFDNLCSFGKKDLIIAEIKTKARMNKFEATGIDTRNLSEYLLIMNKYSIEVFLFFVDEMLKKIYGNKLSVLMESYVNHKKEVYPMLIKNKTITLFSLDKMINICDLDDSVSEELKSLSTRNYDYLESV